MEQRTVNAMGMACPLPVVNAKKAMDEFQEDGELIVLVDNETAVQNLTKLAQSRSFAVSSEKKAEKEYAVTIQVKAGGSAPLTAEEESCTCAPEAGRGTVAVISAAVMGGGDDKLGQSLMKAFLFALSKQDILPDAVLFYNGGAALTCEGSESLEDLKAMEAEGVKIMTCGTCLDFYGLKEKLAVGTVTNMYDIVETQEKAARILRP